MWPKPKRYTADEFGADHQIDPQCFYTAFHKNIPAGISGCRKKRLNNGMFF